MEELLVQIYDQIQGNLNAGYNLDELKPEDSTKLDGFVWAIANIEIAFDNLECFMDDSAIGKIKQEYAEDILEHVYTCLICDACDLVYSIMDGYEE